MRKNSFIKQCVIVFFLVGCVSLSVKAQYSVGVTGNYAVATDDLAKGAKNGYGATLHTRYHFDDYLSMGIDVGYVMFDNKKSDSKISPLIDGDKLTIIPVTAAFQMNFSNKKVKPFVCLDLGWAYGNLKLTTNSKNFGMVSPQFGIDYEVTDQLNLRFSVKDNVLIYNRLAGGSDIISYIGLNFGVMYKL